MIKKETIWVIQCDCGRRVYNSPSWLKRDLIEDVQIQGWKKVNSKWLCPVCQEIKKKNK